MPLDSNVNYINYDEVLVGENHPLGLTDTLNRALKEFSAKFDLGLADTQVVRQHIKIASATDVAIGVASDDYVWLNPVTMKYEKAFDDRVLGIIDMDIFVVYTFGLTTFKTKNTLTVGTRYYLDIMNPGTITTNPLSGIMVGLGMGTNKIMNVAATASAAASSSANANIEIPIDLPSDIADGVENDDIVYYNSESGKWEKAFDSRATGIIDKDLLVVNAIGYYTFRTINDLVKGTVYYLDVNNPGTITTGDESGIVIGTAYDTAEILNITSTGKGGNNGGTGVEVTNADANKELTNNGVDAFWSPIRINPSVLVSDFSMPIGSNGSVAGPFIISDSANLTVPDGSVLVIN